MALFEARDISVSYKKIKAISNAFIDANEGEIIGFIGADGVGKSSLMHAISGVVKFQGEVKFGDTLFHSPEESEPAKSLIGLMPQGIGLVLYDTLSVSEHLDFFANIRGIKEDKSFKNYKEKLLHMAGLLEFKDAKAGNLSGGMMQKLSLICTLLHRPKLLVLDEPTTGVDPLSRLELWDILEQIREEEGSIAIVSTAYMEEANKMDRIYLFEDGKIIASDTSANLLKSAEPYTYEPVECKDAKNCIKTGHFTYSLTKLDATCKKPTLEALFFISALKKGKSIPPIDVTSKETAEEIPDIVMEAKGLTKHFGKFVADDHIDLTLHSNEIVGLLGANGAGKTTFIKMLLGLYPIDEGELRLLGSVIKSPNDRQKLKSKIGYVSQHFALYDNLSIRENLIYFANMHQIPMQKSLKIINRYAVELGFEEYLDELPSTLPLGINQRFSVAAALLHEPVMLFLDEPTSGVDAVARSQFWQMLHLLKEKWGISIIITTHYMSEAEFCDRVVLLKRGKKVADDSVENLYKKHPSAKNFEEIFISYYKDKS